MAALLADYGKAVYMIQWTSNGTRPKRQQIDARRDSTHHQRKESKSS
jgi:hypothetical protein